MEATNRAKGGSMFRMLPVNQCPLCGGEGEPFKPSKDLLSLEGYDKFLKVYSADVCQNCGTIYQNPCLSDLERYYGSGAYRLEHPKNPIFSDSDTPEVRRSERLVTVIDRFNINPKSCLDVGCGTGELLRQLEIFFYAKVLGLEYDRTISGIDNMVYSKEDVVDTFDLITCIHVMEHMAEPVKELEWMLSKLNPGGTILLELPMAMSPTMAHLYVPSRKGLEIMLNNLNLDYVYLPHEIICNILIGDNYSNYFVQKVYYTYESPDFDTKTEVHNWLKNSYDTKG